MAINHNDDYKKLADLLYPSIEASGNVYYGQTKKLTMDEVFNKNDLGFESRIDAVRSADTPTKYIGNKFTWKIGPLHDTVTLGLLDGTESTFKDTRISKYIDLTSDATIEKDLSTSFNLKGTIFLKYILVGTNQTEEHILNSATYNSYNYNYTAELDSIVITNNQNPVDLLSEDNQSFYVDITNNEKCLYIKVFSNTLIKYKIVEDTDTGDTADTNTEEIYVGAEYDDPLLDNVTQPLAIKAIGGDLHILISYTPASVDDDSMDSFIYTIDGGSNEIGDFNTQTIDVSEGSIIRLYSTYKDAYDFYEGNPSATIDDDHSFLHVTISSFNGGKAAIYGNIESLINRRKFTNIQYSPCEEIVKNAFYGMFSANETIVKAPILRLHFPSDFAYGEMFRHCNNLVNAKIYFETSVYPKGCFYETFNGCSSLQKIQSLTSDDVNTIFINDSSFSYTFNNCTSLKYGLDFSKITFDVENGTTDTFKNMYQNCSALINASKFNLLNCSQSTFTNTFKNCTSLNDVLIVIDDINPNTVNFINTFENCTSLDHIPFLNNSLPVNENTIYSYTFSGCTSLTNVVIDTDEDTSSLWLDNLPYTFENCTSLTSLTINSKYALSFIDDDPVTWLSGVTTNGSIFCAPGTNSHQYIPDSWVDEINDPLTLKAVNGPVTVSIINHGTNEYLYKYDHQHLWSDFTGQVEIPSGGKLLVMRKFNSSNDEGAYLNNLDPNYSAQFQFTRIDGTNGTIEAHGNIVSLLYTHFYYRREKSTFVSEPKQDNLLANTFRDCTLLTKAPILPWKTLSTLCYAHMFTGCTSLVEAPELPATTLDHGCYISMFSGCTSLTKAPKLPATIPEHNCYYSMFSGCTSLVEAPELPIVNFGDKHECYSSMFLGCTSLTKVPKFTVNLEPNNHVLAHMFYDCSSLEDLYIDFVNPLTNNDNNFEYWLSWTAENSYGCLTTNTDTILPLLPDNWGTSKHHYFNDSNNDIPYIYVSGSSANELGRKVSDDKSVFNMQSKDLVNTYSEILNNFNDNGSLNQEIFGYKCFNDPVSFRNGIYGECASLTTLSLNDAQRDKYSDIKGSKFECSPIHTTGTDINNCGLLISNCTGVEDDDSEHITSSALLYVTKSYNTLNNDLTYNDEPEAYIKLGTRKSHHNNNSQITSSSGGYAIIKGNNSSITLSPESIYITTHYIFPNAIDQSLGNPIVGNKNNRFKEVWTDKIGTSFITNDDDIILSQSLIPERTNTLCLGDIEHKYDTIYSTTIAADDVIATTLRINKISTSDSESTISMYAHIAPYSDGFYSIGSSTKKFDAVYANDFYGNFHGNIVGGTASVWPSAKNFTISDANGTNTGTSTSVDGSSNVTLKLPNSVEYDQVTASTIQGTTTASSSTTTIYINSDKLDCKANCTLGSDSVPLKQIFVTTISSSSNIDLKKSLIPPSGTHIVSLGDSTCSFTNTYSDYIYTTKVFISKNSKLLIGSNSTTDSSEVEIKASKVTVNSPNFTTSRLNVTGSDVAVYVPNGSVSARLFLGDLNGTIPYPEKNNTIPVGALILANISLYTASNTSVTLDIGEHLTPGGADINKYVVRPGSINNNITGEKILYGTWVLLSRVYFEPSTVIQGRVALIMRIP